LTVIVTDNQYMYGYNASLSPICCVGREPQLQRRQELSTVTKQRVRYSYT